MALKSMELDDEAKSETIMPIAMSDRPDYPYGLMLSLCDAEIEKLGIDPAALSVGGVIHIEAMAKVTSVSIRDGEDGASSRVELQITDMGVLGPSEQKPKRSIRSLYTASEGN